MEPDVRQSETEAEPIMPQVTIRFMMGVIAACALAMWTLRGAFLEGWFWAQCVSVALIAAVLCFLLYAAVFAVASVFAALFGAILMPFGEPPSSNDRNGSDGVNR